MKLIKNIKPGFIDKRGTITRLLDNGKTNIRSVLWITSKKGTVRSNHYHKKDAHYIYVVSGKMEYYERPVKNKNFKIKKVVLSAGDMVYTPPMMIHATKFSEETVILTLSIKFRNHQSYESDTVRVKLI